MRRLIIAIGLVFSASAIAHTSEIDERIREGEIAIARLGEMRLAEARKFDEARRNLMAQNRKNLEEFKRRSADELEAIKDHMQGLLPALNHPVAAERNAAEKQMRDLEAMSREISSRLREGENDVAQKNLGLSALTSPNLPRYDSDIADLRREVAQLRSAKMRISQMQAAEEMKRTLGPVDEAARNILEAVDQRESVPAEEIMAPARQILKRAPTDYPKYIEEPLTPQQQKAYDEEDHTPGSAQMARQNEIKRNNLHERRQEAIKEYKDKPGRYTTAENPEKIPEWDFEKRWPAILNSADKRVRAEIMKTAPKTVTKPSAESVTNELLDAILK